MVPELNLTIGQFQEIMNLKEKPYQLQIEDSIYSIQYLREGQYNKAFVIRKISKESQNITLFDSLPGDKYVFKVQKNLAGYFDSAQRSTHLFNQLNASNIDNQNFQKASFLNFNIKVTSDFAPLDNCKDEIITLNLWITEYLEHNPLDARHEDDSKLLKEKNFELQKQKERMVLDLIVPGNGVTVNLGQDKNTFAILDTGFAVTATYNKNFLKKVPSFSSLNALQSSSALEFFKKPYTDKLKTQSEEKSFYNIMSVNYPISEAYEFTKRHVEKNLRKKSFFHNSQLRNNPFLQANDLLKNIKFYHMDLNDFLDQPTSPENIQEKHRIFVDTEKLLESDLENLLKKLKTLHFKQPRFC